METAIIYARVSTSSQDTARQIADLQAYAEKNGLKVEGIFEEKISGAKKNSERSALCSAFEYAKNNGVEVILFSEVSRLGRNTMEVLESVKTLADNGINAYFAKENFFILDEKGKVSPITTIFMSCLGMVGEIERENIRYRLKSGYDNFRNNNNGKVGRKEGYRDSAEVKENKYPISLKFIRKGYKLTEVLDLAKGRGEKVSMATLKRLKKEIKEGRV